MDTEESIWPNPITRSEVRIGNLQNRIERYAEGAGKLPVTLADLLPPGEEIGELARDAWGSAFQYRRMSSDYELRAAGPDRVFHTDDDIVATKNTSLPNARRDPVSDSRTIIESLQMLVTLFESRTGSLPGDLSALSGAGLSPYLGTHDVWKQPIGYRRWKGDFELRSAGPDTRLHTRDDIRVTGRHPLLAMPCSSRIAEPSQAKG